MVPKIIVADEEDNRVLVDDWTLIEEELPTLPLDKGSSASDRVLDSQATKVSIAKRPNA